jgi:predicted DCC family thiol-disulfide oxidoreductase YuxK
MMPRPYILIYDGQCRLCRGAVRLIWRLGPDRPLQTIDFHDSGRMAQVPQVDPAQAAQSVILVSPDGRQFRAYEAIVGVIGILPAIAWLSPLLRLTVVRPLGDRVYAWVAAHRHQISCRIGG